MKFYEYVNENGYPDKVVAFDIFRRYQTIKKSDYNVPIVLNMKVDHVEKEFLHDGHNVVFLRCPQGVLV